MTETIWKREYYDNGSLLYETPYVNGKIHGVYRVYFYHNGKLWHETPYVNGKIHGIERRFSDTGNLSYEQCYLHGKKVTKEEWRELELITQLAEL